MSSEVETLAAKDPDIAKTYTFDWRERVVGEVARSIDYAADAIALPQRDTGFFLECTVAGRTASYYPSWPRQKDQMVRDGSVVWTTRHPDDVTIPSVSTAVWTVPAALTVDSQDETGTITEVTISGGVDGVVYEISVRMTPSAGDAVDRTFLLPVSHL